ncbi:helix-turn-helix domain-containing protein [Streptomyces sp. NPDC048331]|uniref:helix-turn-helix domain-containing protein n=1 Tax=Streptomyces sp. NPDC048331 TaxID=3365534 RepID=UPI00371AF411
MSRSDDVLKVHRLAHAGGSAALLEWLAAHLGGWVGVVDAEAEHGRVPEAAVRGAAELTARGVRSAVLHDGDRATLLFALDGPRAPAAVLAAVLERPHDPGAPALLADAAVPLALVLRAEEAERREERVRRAELRTREAVLRLLMSGLLPTAHQIAGALGPALPDPLRLYVVECPAGRLAEVGALCRELTDGRAWIVRCPVYVRHLIVLAPTGPAAGRPLAGALVEAAPDCTVGVSGEMRLSEAPVAYTQAFHALAVARGREERHARFGPGPELALAAHEAGAGWAGALLAPLHTHEPRRPQDPGGQELRATAEAWLNFASHATRLLRIHRNTLAARLRLIEVLLGLDLARLPDQAALSLALRLTPGAGRASGTSPEHAPGLDEVLRDPRLTEWARGHLNGLTGPDAPPGARDTVRVWLAHDAQLGPAAAAMGVSVPGARKRLTRIEALLERSLLQSPSARYDLWLAHRAEGLAEDRAEDLAR